MITKYEIKNYRKYPLVDEPVILRTINVPNPNGRNLDKNKRNWKKK